MTAILQHSAADVLVAVMIGLDLVTDPQSLTPGGWPCHISHLPPDDAKCVAVYDTEPVPEGRIISSGEVIRRWGCQIVVRAAEAEYARGWAKMVEILTALEAVSLKAAAMDDGAYRIREVSVESGPMFFGREPEVHWPKFSANVLILYGKV